MYPTQFCFQGIGRKRVPFLLCKATVAFRNTLTTGTTHMTLAMLLLR